MDKQSISVIIPVYNAEKYLSQCIESVINQTYSCWELILINDGSTDNSLSICKKYASTDSRIKIINQPNRGVSAARNAGLDICLGTWISFLDADDSLSPNAFDVCIKSSVINNAEIVFSNLNLVYTHDEVQLFDTFPWQSELSQALYEYLLVPRIRPSWIIIKKELFNKSNFRFPTELTIFEDLCALSLIAAKAERVSHVGQYLYNYRIDNSSSITKNISGRATWHEVEKAMNYMELRLKSYQQGSKLVKSLYYRWLFVMQGMVLAPEKFSLFKSVLPSKKRYILSNPNLSIRIKLFMILILNNCGFAVGCYLKIRRILSRNSCK